MKKNKLFSIFTVIVTAIIIVTPSCDSDFLDENPKSFLSPDNAFSDTKGFETALTGIYYLWRQELSGIIYGTLQAGTDNCVTGGAHNVHLIAEEYININSTYGGDFWYWGYNLIGNVNQILDHVNDEDVDWDDPADKNRVEAEARFFRAYAYRDMIYLYGDVPLVKEMQKPFRLDFTRQPVSEVLNLIIEDLLFAAEYLPETTVQDGKLVEAAARHLLSEIYLFADDPAKAEEQARLVIESGNHHLMTERFGNYLDKPGDAFSDLFEEHNYNRSSGNMEGILVVQFEWDAIGGGANRESREWIRRAWVPYYSKISGFVLCDSLGGRGIGRLVPLQWWLDAYETQDMRNSQYNLRRHYWYNNPTFEKYGQEVEMTDEYRTLGYLYPSTTKFDFGITEVNSKFTDNFKDRYKFRLGETYLLLAEAQMLQNKLDAAAATVNILRSRANATPVTSADIDMDFILDERARELFGEEDRRFTLVRTGTLLERVRSLNPRSGAVIQDYNVLWPIPQGAIDANKEAALTQNPGYN